MIDYRLDFVDDSGVAINTVNITTGLRALNLSEESTTAVNYFTKAPRRFTFNLIASQNAWALSEIINGSSAYIDVFGIYALEAKLTEIVGLTETVIFRGIVDAKSATYDSRFIKIIAYDKLKLFEIYDYLTADYAGANGEEGHTIMTDFATAIQSAVGGYPFTVSFPSRQPLELLETDYEITKIESNNNDLSTLDYVNVVEQCCNYGFDTSESIPTIRFLYIDAFYYPGKTQTGSEANSNPETTITVKGFTFRIYNAVCIAEDVSQRFEYSNTYKMGYFQSDLGTPPVYTKVEFNTAGTTSGYYEKRQALISAINTAGYSYLLSNHYIDFTLITETAPGTMPFNPTGLKTRQYQTTIDNSTTYTISFNNTTKKFETVFTGTAIPYTLQAVGEDDTEANFLDTVKAVLFLGNITVLALGSGGLYTQEKFYEPSGFATGISDNAIHSFSQKRIEISVPDARILDALQGDTTYLKLIMEEYYKSLISGKKEITLTVYGATTYSLVMFSKITVFTKTYVIISINKNKVKDIYQIKAWEI